MISKDIPYYCALYVQSHLNVSTTIITPCGSVVLFLPCYMLRNNLPRSGRHNVEGTSGNQERSICSVCNLEQRKQAANVFRWSQVISHHTSHSCLQCCWSFCVLFTQATVHSGKAPLPSTFYVFIMRLQLSSANLSDLSILFLNDVCQKNLKLKTCMIWEVNHSYKDWALPDDIYSL